MLHVYLGIRGGPDPPAMVLLYSAWLSSRQPREDRLQSHVRGYIDPGLTMPVVLGALAIEMIWP